MKAMSLHLRIPVTKTESKQKARLETTWRSQRFPWLECGCNIRQEWYRHYCLLLQHEWSTPDGIFVTIEQIEDLDNLLCYVSISRVTSLRSPFFMHGFDCSCSASSMSFHPGVSADYVTTPSTGKVTGAYHVLNNSAKIVLVDGRRHLKAIEQLHMKGAMVPVQEHILVLFIVWEGIVAITKAIGIELSGLANKINGILRCNSTCVNLMKTTLNLFIVFGKEYNEKVMETLILDIVIGVKRSDSQTGIRAQSYCRYIRIANIILRHGSVHTLVESLNGDISMTLNCTQKPESSCTISLDRQATLWRTKKNQLQFTARRSTPGRRYL